MKSKLLLILLPLTFSGCFASLPAAEPQEHSIKQELNHQFIEAAKEGSTALMLDLLRTGTTVTFGNGTIVKVCPDIDARDINNETALHKAAGNGHLECLEALIKAQADVNARTEGGLTALHKASQSGHLDCVKALIEAQADVNARDDGGSTALHFAALENKLECVKALLAAQANVDARTEGGFTALHLAVATSHLDCVKVLAKHSYGLVPTLEAASQSRKRISEFLFQLTLIRKQFPHLDNIKSESLHHEMLSWESLQEDLVIVLLDELKKGREIKNVTLIRSKDAAVSYLFKRVEDIVSPISLVPTTPAMNQFLDPFNRKEPLRALIKEGLDERIEQLKSINS